MAEKRYFVLRQGARETAVFTGKQPRQAALKAASRGYTDIRLRERGTNKIHVYRGSRRKVAAPMNRPSWMASMVWKPNVRKVGIERIMKKKAAKKKRARRARRRVTRKRTTRRRKTTRRKRTTRKRVTRKRPTRRRRR